MRRTNFLRVKFVSLLRFLESVRDNVRYQRTKFVFSFASLCVTVIGHALICI